MTKEDEIEIEFQRLLKLIEVACKNKLIILNWFQSDLAKEMDIQPSSLCDFINGRENHSLRKIVACLYYLGLQLDVNVKTGPFKVYTPVVKPPKK
ncbi:MAG: hypothetical protein POELPBGB_01990 [Bacteroidia bacterium]|nr:hypothetical protein [Bacteroidia bacterium]